MNVDKNEYMHLVFTLRNAGGDCTANGVTSRFEMMYAVDNFRAFYSATKGMKEGVTLEYDHIAYNGLPVLFLDIYRPDTPDAYKSFDTVPSMETDRFKRNSGGSMAGGAYVTTSDSRFSKAFGKYPLGVHDRFEGSDESTTRTVHNAFYKCLESYSNVDLTGVINNAESIEV